MQLPDLALEEAKLTALARVVADQLKEVRTAMQGQLDRQGVRTVDATLPDGTKVGTISRTTPKPTALITDEKAFTKWVAGDRPRRDDLPRRDRGARRASDRAARRDDQGRRGGGRGTETGEIHAVPGVTVATPRAAGHRVLVTNEQIDAIATAWRTGQLTAIDLPQLGTTNTEGAAT